MLNLAIIVPLYNPHGDWYKSICESIEGLNLHLGSINYSIILVNDGSTNFDESDSKKLTDKYPNVKYISYPINRGKGQSIRLGLSQVQANHYIYTDIDFPFGFEIIKKMYELLNNTSTNLIIGIRNKEYFNLLPRKRKILSRALHVANLFLTSFKVHDTQAGIKGFDNKAKEILLQTKTNEFLFDLEFVRNCLRKKLKYTLIDIHPRAEIKFSEFRAKVIRQEIKNMSKIIFKF
jgi:hypothetical protein